MNTHKALSIIFYFSHRLLKLTPAIVISFEGKFLFTCIFRARVTSHFELYIRTLRVKGPNLIPCSEKEKELCRTRFYIACDGWDVDKLSFILVVWLAAATESIVTLVA